MNGAAVTLQLLAVRLQQLAGGLLVLTGAAWLLFLATGWIVLRAPAVSLPAGALLAASLILAFLAALLLARLRRGRACRQVNAQWEALDRRDPEELTAHLSRIHARAPLLGARIRRRTRNEVLRALLELEPDACSRETGAVLAALLQENESGITTDTLAHGAGLVPEGAVPPLQVLQLWNKVDARGGVIPAGRVAGLFRELARRPSLRGLSGVAPLLYESARRGEHAGLDLLANALNEGALAVAQVPKDLLDALLKGSTLAHKPRRSLERRLGILEAATARGAAVSLEAAPAGAPPSLERTARTAGSLLTATRDLLGGVATYLVEFAGEGQRRRAVRRLGASALALAAVVIVATLGVRWIGERGSGGGSSASRPSLKYYSDPADTLGRGYTIQVMASKDSAQARAEALRLRQAGYWVYLLGPRENSAWFRVRLGRFDGRSEADSVAAGLKERRVIDAWYVANHETARMVFGSERTTQ